MELDHVFVFLKQSYLLIPVLVILVCAFVKIDGMINNEEKSTSDYAKAVLITVLTALVVGHIHGLKETLEPMLMGPPDF